MGNLNPYKITHQGGYATKCNFWKFWGKSLQTMRRFAIQYRGGSLKPLQESSGISPTSFSILSHHSSQKLSKASCNHDQRQNKINSCRNFPVGNPQKTPAKKHAKFKPWDPEEYLPRIPSHPASSIGDGTVAVAEVVTWEYMRAYKFVKGTTSSHRPYILSYYYIMFTYVYTF